MLAFHWLSMLLLALPTAGDEKKAELAKGVVVRPSKISPADREEAERHYQVARWCEKRGHLPQMREQARCAVEKNPGHEDARELLGHIQLKGQWLSPEELWQRRDDLQREVDGEFKKLISRQQADRDAARLALHEYARIPGLEELANHADRLHEQAAQLWRAKPRAVLELRTTSSSLVGLKERSVGTGVGNPVKIQLPELKSASVGTTVVVPLGGG